MPQLWIFFDNFCLFSDKKFWNVPTGIAEHLRNFDFITLLLRITKWLSSGRVRRTGFASTASAGSMITQYQDKYTKKEECEREREERENDRGFEIGGGTL